MHRTEAYSILGEILESWRKKPIEDLVNRIDGVGESLEVSTNNEVIKIEVSFRWVDEKKEQIIVKATANGPSNWTLERLEERILVLIKD